MLLRPCSRRIIVCRGHLYSSGIDCRSSFPSMGEQAIDELAVVGAALGEASVGCGFAQSSAELHNLRVPLPPHWRVAWASSQALPYYYNNLTHETTWCYYEEVDQHGMPDLPPGWQRAWHPRGSRWFYWGPEAQEATYTCPNHAWGHPPEPPPRDHIVGTERRGTKT